MQKAVEPIEKRLEVIETARGISKQEEKHEEEIQKSNSVWDGVL
ncbi:hypothetical protein bcere0016_55800 [Bacillus cereus 95/8201]|nr:hypothetical protein bcere0016_55800 [Bacillus cereus 95/8201]